jgi:hypothetical protein
MKGISILLNLLGVQHTVLEVWHIFSLRKCHQEINYMVNFCCVIILQVTTAARQSLQSHACKNITVKGVFSRFVPRSYNLEILVERAGSKLGYSVPGAICTATWPSKLEESQI